MLRNTFIDAYQKIKSDKAKNRRTFWKIESIHFSLKIKNEKTFMNQISTQPKNLTLNHDQDII